MFVIFLSDVDNNIPRSLKDTNKTIIDLNVRYYRLDTVNSI